MLSLVKTDWERVYLEDDRIVVKKEGSKILLSLDKAFGIAKKIPSTDPRKMMLVRVLPPSGDYKFLR